MAAMLMLYVVNFILYTLSFVAGLIIAIPALQVRSDFQGVCILYTDGVWNKCDDKYSLISVHGNSSNCLYNIFCGLTVAVGSFLVMIAIFFVILKSCQGNSHRPFPVWIPTIVNGITAFLLFVNSCNVAVGFDIFCKSITKEPDGKFPNCIDAQDKFNWMEWKVDGRRFYDSTHLSMMSSWCCVVLFLFLTILSALYTCCGRYNQDPEETGALDNYLTTTCPSVFNRRRTTQATTERSSREVVIPQPRPSRPTEDETCIICFNHRRNYALLPCGHQHFCEACARELHRRGEPCPVCRTPINQTNAIFS